MQPVILPLPAGFKPIALQDVPLYRQFFARETHLACYGNSWLYLTQACRGFGLGLMYHDVDLLVSLGSYRGHYVVVRPLGNLDARFFNLLAELNRLSGKPVFIKKLFPEQVSQMEGLPGIAPAATYDFDAQCSIAGVYTWEAACHADDDTYPELIFDLAVDVSQRWHPRKSNRKLRTNYLRQARQFIREGVPARLDDYRPGEFKQIELFLQAYFGAQRADNLDAYHNLLHLPQPGADCFRWVAYAGYEQQVAGFYALERLDSQSFGMYANVTSRAYFGLPEYLNEQIGARLRELGVRYLNVGGSETYGLHQYKSKPIPAEERYMPMLVYGAT